MTKEAGWRDEVTSQGNLEPPSARRGKEGFLPGASEEAGSCILISDFGPPE